MKSIDIYRNYDAFSPLILIPVFEGNGRGLWSACQNISSLPVTLAVLSEVNWDSDMTPWPHDHFSGQADIFLQELETEILPYILKEIGYTPNDIILAGYSLAGLFALYASYNSDIFSGVISASGSLWYPGFTDYLREHTPSTTLQYAYLSLGNKEHKTKHPLMRTVLQKTTETRELLEQKGIQTTFVSEEGNHFREPDARTARGIAWMIRQLQEEP